MPEHDYISREFAIVREFLKAQMSDHTEDIAALKALLQDEPNGMVYRVRELERSDRQIRGVLVWLKGIAAALVIGLIFTAATQAINWYHAYETLKPLVDQISKTYETLKPLIDQANKEKK